MDFMDFGTNESIRNGESREHYLRRIEEEIVAEDWEVQFDLYMQEFNQEFEALEEALECNGNEAYKAFISGQRDYRVNQMMHLVRLGILKDEILAKRQEFEEQFGYLEQEPQE